MKCIIVTGVFFWICIMSLRIRPHPKGQTCLMKCSEATSTKCPVTTKALTSTMTVLTTIKYFSFFLIRLHFSFASDHKCRLYIELFIIKRLYIKFWINTLYIQMKGRKIEFSIFLPWNWARTLYQGGSRQNKQNMEAAVRWNGDNAGNDGPLISY